MPITVEVSDPTDTTETAVLELVSAFYDREVENGENRIAYLDACEDIAKAIGDGEHWNMPNASV